MRTRSSFVFLFFVVALSGTLLLRAEDQAAPAAQSSEESAAAVPEPSATPAPADQSTKASAKKKRIEHADAFIAPPDWEFDGFVAGGQDQEVRSMFYLNDLEYINVGTDQGFSA